MLVARAVNNVWEKIHLYRKICLVQIYRGVFSSRTVVCLLIVKEVIQIVLLLSVLKIIFSMAEVSIKRLKSSSGW